MSLNALAQDRSWLKAVRESCESDLEPSVRDDPLYRSMIQYGMTLVGLALDYHLAGVKNDRASVDGCVERIGTLGREFTGGANDIEMEERLVSIGLVSTCFVSGLLHAIRNDSADPYMGGFLTAALMTWGIFYDKIEIDFPPPSRAY